MSVPEIMNFDETETTLNAYGIEGGSELWHYAQTASCLPATGERSPSRSTVQWK